MMPTGLFCCVVPDATGVMQWACANVCELIVGSYNPLLSPPSLQLLPCLYKSVMVELLQLQDRATPSPVVFLELVSPPTSGGKMVQSFKVKQQRCSPGLLSDCLMPVSYTHLTLPTNREV